MGTEDPIRTADVQDLVRRWAAAEQQGDAGLLGALLADDFRGVGPCGSS